MSSREPVWKATGKLCGGLFVIWVAFVATVVACKIVYRLAERLLEFF